MALKLHRNDTVIVLTGKDKGKKSIIKSIISSKKVILDRLNLVKKHQKPVPSKNQNGGIIEKEAPIQISNIAIFNPDSKKADRVGFRFEQGKKIRFFKSNGKIIK